MEDIVYEIVRVIGRDESRNLSRAGISLQIGIVLYSRSRRCGKEEMNLRRRGASLDSGGPLD